jgi:hypothetical protein
MNVSAQKTLILVCGLVLAGCSGGNSSPSPQQVVTLSASPATYTFPLDDNTPEPVSVTRSNGTFTSLALGVADPTVVGVTAPALNGASATFSVIPIAHGATTVTATDSTGAATSVSVTTASCGRPASLVAAQQVVPTAGATGVSASIGTLYFVAYGGGTGNLHLIVGAHGTLEGGPFVAATLPPGTVLPPPIPLPGVTDTIVSATVPALVPGQQYQTQLYNDTCQPAVLAGTFST